MFFVEQKINFNKNKTKTKMDMPHTFQREKPCASADIKIVN